MMHFICVTILFLCSFNDNLFITGNKYDINQYHTGLPIIYPIDRDHLLVTLPSRTTLPLIVQDVDTDTSFVLVQAHSQSYTLVLSYTQELTPGKFINTTNAGLVVAVNATENQIPTDAQQNFQHQLNINLIQQQQQNPQQKYQQQLNINLLHEPLQQNAEQKHQQQRKSELQNIRQLQQKQHERAPPSELRQLRLFVANLHAKDLAVLLFVSAYSDGDPVPGGGAQFDLPHPYLEMRSSILTTKIIIPPASSTLHYSTSLLESTESVSSSGQFSDDPTTESVPDNPKSFASKLADSVKKLSTTISSFFKHDKLEDDTSSRLTTNSSRMNYTTERTINSTNKDNLSNARDSKDYNQTKRGVMDGSLQVSETSNEQNFIDESVLSRSSNNSSNTSLLYEVFLTYMYEGNMNEDQYWQVLIQTSTPTGLREYATKVAEHHATESAPTPPPYLFISYSGVGAVISVVVTNVNDNPQRGGAYTDDTPLTNSSLYSSAVSYGCDFIPEEKHRCTKLITPLAQVFCASLVFVGFVLVMLGHRWLNFTIFVTGFLVSWFIIFVTFVQIPMVDVHVLGLITFFCALLCGGLWLLVWHRFQLPFVSALPTILQAAFLVAMTTTHFLKYALVPSHANLPVFVIIPVSFALLLVAYSIRNIKAVHILSVVLLGSYATVIPFAFYFGSTLNYIVINSVAAMSVSGYTKAVGYPPFQTCDVVLCIVWISVLILGLVYQRHRERNSPPFLPPNLQYWRATQRIIGFLKDSLVTGYNKVISTCTGRDAEYRSSLTADSNAVYSSTVEDSHAENGLPTVRSDPDPEPFSRRVRANLNSVKIWVTNGMGFQSRSNFANYESFPRYPGEEDGEEEGGGGGREPEGGDNPYYHEQAIIASPEHVSVDSDLRTSVLSPQERGNSFSSRVSSYWCSVRSAFSYGRGAASNLFNRRRNLVDDCDDEDDGGLDDVVSSGSSDDAEVDRRAVGIFGDADEINSVTGSDDASADDSYFVDAKDQDLADRPQHSFGTSQLSFQ